MRINKILKKTIIGILVLIFILIFFNYIINLYIIPNDYEIPIVMLIGFGIIIGLVFYLTFNYRKIKKNNVFIQFHFLNENMLKFILFFIIIITLFIPPVSFSRTIIDWDQISIYSYLKSITIIIALLFLPGANIFSLFFKNKNLLKRYDIEPFFLKFTLYPLISLTVLATITMFFDSLGFLEVQIELILIYFIIFLFLFDFFTQKRKNDNKKKTHFIKIEITIHTFFIIILILAIIIIASGIMFSSKYLIQGDSWRSISYANYIGNPDTSHYDKFYTSTIYWSYFIFSVSSLCGMPYINTHVLMLPLISLFISAIYLIAKILINKPNKLYAIFSTILATTYSSLFYFNNSYLGKDNISAFIFDGIFNFRYKSFAIILALLSFSLFLISLKESDNYSNSITNNKINYGILILSSWFLIQSLMIYFIPIIPVIFFISFICIYSKNKEHSIRHFIYFLLFLLLFFVIFDLMMTNFFSYVLTTYFGYFFGINLTPLRAELLSNGILIYSITSLFILILFVFYKIYIKKYRNNMKKYHKSKAVNLFIIILFSVFVLFLLDLFFNIILRKEQNFFLFYIHLFFTKIGAVGIIGIFLSYFSFKINKILFYNIISWFSFIFLFASIIIIIRWIQYPNLSPYIIPADEYLYMNYWFDRIWYYSIIPLSLLTAIDLISLIQYIKKIKFFIKINRSVKFIIHFTLTAFLLVVILSNTIIAGMDWYNKRWYIKDDEAQIIGWVSENIPQKSNLLIDSPNFYGNTDDLSGSTTYIISDELLEAIDNDNSSIYGNIYREIGDECQLSLIDELDNYYNVINFSDFNNNGYVGIDILPAYANSFGTIEFNIRTSNGNNSYWIDLDSILPDSHGISIPIYNNSFSYYNGSEYIKMMDIENEKWYNYKLDFDCTNNSYLGLNQYHWKATINGTVFGDFPFWNNISSIGYISLKTSLGLANWNTYIEGIELSWVSGFNIINSVFKYLIFIQYLNLKTINYYIHKITEINYYKKIVEQYISIENELIQHYFSKILFEYGDVTIHSISSL